MALSFYRRSVSERRNIMSFFSWLRNSLENRARRARPRPPAPRFRPRLEALEDRCVPTSTTLKVTSLLDNGPGSLRYEIAQAQSNDTIVFDFGNKKVNSTPHTILLTSGNELFIGKNLTIQGPSAGLTISPFNWNTSRIFEVGYGATVTLSGLTITHGGGYAAPSFSGSYADDGNGGAILNHVALPMSGCTLSNNSAVAPQDSAAFGNPGSQGGAIFSTGVLTVSGCTLSNNSAAYGGGIYNAGTLTMSGCTLSNNSAYAGGGIYSNIGSASVFNSTITGNTANTQGGGIYSAFGTMTVNGCTLSGNTASFYPQGGGGIYNLATTMTVSNSLFSGNTPDNILGPYTDGGGNTFN